MWVRRRWPDRAETFRPVAQRLAFVGVGIMLVLDRPETIRGPLSATCRRRFRWRPCSSSCSAAAGWMAAAIVTDESARSLHGWPPNSAPEIWASRSAVAITMLGRVEFARFAYTYFLTELPLDACRQQRCFARHGQALTAPVSRRRCRIGRPYGGVPPGFRAGPESPDSHDETTSPRREIAGFLRPAGD